MSTNTQTQKQTQTQTGAIDEAKLNAFMGKVIADFGASASAVLVVIGDKLGLYKAMAGAGPLTPAELAKKTNTNERYVREWLNANAAGGYVAYDATSARYTLPPEQAMALAEESIRDSFRTGAGMAWGEHAHCLFEGTERFFRPGYVANLTTSWLPALDGA